MMILSPEQAHEMLTRIDPARLWLGWPVGLRDGALLALVAAGLSAEELAELRASAITMDREGLHVAVRRRGIRWTAALPTDLGARLLVWLSERRLWAEPEPVFNGPRGPLSAKQIHQLLFRYRRRRKNLK